jgi:NAD(P)H-flavin reductase
VKRVPNGKASTYLWGLSGGEEVRFRGPMGRFALRNPERKQIFVSTGTGIAPIRSMWQSLLEKENPPEIELIFGVRHEEHLFCMDEFTACVPHMNTSVCLSRPSGEGGNYFHGRVTDFARHMDSFHFEKAEVYLCGSKPMVDEMKDILAKKGVGADRIGVESW